MGDDNGNSSSTVTAIVIGVLAAGVLVIGVCGGLMLVSGLFWVRSVESEPMQVHVIPMTPQEMTPEELQTSDNQPHALNGLPSVNNEQTNSVDDTQPAPQPTPEPLRPAKEEAADVATEHVLSNFPLTTENVAWSAPTVTATEDGGYQVTGAFTADGISHRWSCTLEFQDIDGQRQWKCGRLEVDGKRLPQE
jgi:hypothetical protein